MEIRFNIGGSLRKFESPLIMGIINATPDSFYGESRISSPEKIKERAEKMISEGADILDIGSCSTRPGSISVSEEEETDRLDAVMPAIMEIAKGRVLVSVDTFRASVAAHCIDKYKVDIINDVSGAADEQMADVIGKADVGYVLMHTRGTPADMHKYALYKDVTSEVISELAFKLSYLRSRNVRDVIIDPGFGFAKNLEENYKLFSELSEFRSLGCPVLVGISRKSMLTNLLGNTADEALTGTTVLNTLALEKGASILRVHDVKEAAEIRTIFGKLQMAAINN